MKITKLQKAVIEQLGYDVKKDKDEYMEVFKHGITASDGYTGFTYYSETKDFYKKHKKEIIQLAKDTAFGIGEDSYISMILKFGCLQGHGRKITIDDVCEVIYANNKNNKYYTDITNALAWFALEETAFDLGNQD